MAQFSGANRQMASRRMNPGLAQLGSGSNATTAAYTDWTITQQTLGGWWERVWDFGSCVGTGLPPSGPPDIDNTYVVYHMSVFTNVEHVKYNYASGVQYAHEIDYYSDSVSGGYGTSGWCYTVSGGYTRVSGTVGTAGICTQPIEGVVTGATLPGEYVLPNAQDTQDTLISTFAGSVLPHAAQVCPDFDISLVNV